MLDIFKFFAEYGNAGGNAGGNPTVKDADRIKDPINTVGGIYQERALEYCFERTQLEGFRNFACKRNWGYTRVA